MIMKDRKKKIKSFAGVPRQVMDNPSYKNLSAGGKSLLFELAYQFRGRNNGDLCAAHGVVSKRLGGICKTTANNWAKELVSANMIIRTRQGCFRNPNRQCSLFALTWESIDECDGKLEVNSTRTPPRNFALEANLNKSPEQ